MFCKEHVEREQLKTGENRQNTKLIPNGLWNLFTWAQSKVNKIASDSWLNSLPNLHWINQLIKNIQCQPFVQYTEFTSFHILHLFNCFMKILIISLQKLILRLNCIFLERLSFCLNLFSSLLSQPLPECLRFVLYFVFLMLLFQKILSYPVW